ncbi:hypothetical protein [Algoriphagus winogradskyi]|uniref:Lipocalin-like domain-containing protein n=1 Tax=Algoriphagus winogradskyi TaxID=237017 RepID=A0ABY1PGD2_9BACT|nr:hypothetical protein [Algoriphagus winogradskyi]SMP33772.1 hypothetical protein SAMN06265367_1091 [Algoriphagus winogradskyi]
MIKLLIYIIPILLIDPSYLLGKWKLTKSEAHLNLIVSEAFLAGTKEQQDKLSKINNLYLNNATYTFKEDSIFWTDVSPSKEVVIEKYGKYILKKDTLFVFDGEKFKTYKFLLKEINSNEMEMRIIFSNGDIARSASYFIRQ